MIVSGERIAAKAKGLRRYYNWLSALYNYHCIAWDSSLTLRMTAVFSMFGGSTRNEVEPPLDSPRSSLSRLNLDTRGSTSKESRGILRPPTAGRLRSG